MPVAAGPPGPPTGWSREAREPRRPVPRCTSEGERRWTRRARTSDRQENGYIYSLNRLDRDCRVYCKGYVAAHSVASPGSAAQRSIGLPRLQYAGGVGADFDWQAPRAPTDLGRHGPLHDDRDGPTGEPPEDASSGEPEGHHVRGDGGGQDRRHPSPRARRERLPPRPGVRGRTRDQPVCPPGPDGPPRLLGDVRIREEGELAAHDPPRWMERGEGQTARRERGETPDLLQSRRAARGRRPPGEDRPGRGRGMRSPRPRVRMRADVVSRGRERGGVPAPQGGHGHPDRRDLEPPRTRCPEGGVPRRPESHAERRGAAQELRSPEPLDEGAVGRAQRGRRLRSLPGTRGDRVPARRLRIPRGPRDLEGRVPGEDAREAARLRPDPGREEFPGPRRPRPPVRPSLVGLLWREGKTPGPLRGMVRQVLRSDPPPPCRSPNTPEDSTPISAASSSESPASPPGSGRSCPSGGIPRRPATCTANNSSSSTSG